jgi:hypothetical protein
MNTEARVLATLNKIKEVQTKRNLGAIEDAVNEVKNNLRLKENEMSSIINELSSQIENIVRQSRALAEELQTSLMESTRYSDLELEYISMAEELDNLGIPFDNILSELGSNYSDAYDVAEEAISKLEL